MKLPFRPLVFTVSVMALPLLLLAGDPPWWSARQVLNGGLTANDYAQVNQGQLKNIAVAASAELDAQLPGGAGATLHALIDSWATAASQTDDFAVINVGQVKNVAQPFYDRLIAVHYADKYPWTASAGSADDLAIANIGQVKNLFSFDLMSVDAQHDADGNGLPDWWEKYYFGSTGVDPTAPATRGDGLTNLQAFQQGLNPIDFYDNSIPHLDKLSGDNQTGEPGNILAEPIMVRVTNSAGQPLSNAPLTFSADASGISIALAPDGSFTANLPVRTAADGTARAYVRLPSNSGSALITVAAQSGQNVQTLTFEEVTAASALPSLSAYSGDNQSAERSRFLFYPLVVQITDASAVPVPNTVVAFNIGAAGGGLVVNLGDTPVSMLNVQTDANGLASVSFLTPDTVGPASVLATLGSGTTTTSIVFNATVRDHPTDLPSAPTGLVAASNPDGSTQLSWSDASDNENQFVIEHQKADGSWEQIGVVGPDQTTFLVPAK